MKFHAYAARPHPEHGMTAPSYAPIPGATGSTETEARAAIPAAVAHLGLPEWRVLRMMREARVFKTEV